MANRPLTGGLPFEIVEHNGQPARKYPDGSIRDEKGKLMTRHPNSAPVIDSQNSTALHRVRAENYRRAALRRIVGEAAAVDPSISKGADAFALLASKQFVALMDYDKPRIDELMAMRDLMTGKDNKDETEPQTINNVYTIDPATRLLIEQLAQIQRSSVIDGIPMRSDNERDAD